jgi:hypothetical protein
MATLIMTAKLNDVDPLAWLADVIGRIAGIPQGRLHKILPWNWSGLHKRLSEPVAKNFGSRLPMIAHYERNDGHG